VSRRKRGEEPTLAEVFAGAFRDIGTRGYEPDWSERATSEQIAKLDDKRRGVTAEQDAVRRLAGRCEACGHAEVDHVEVWTVDMRVEQLALGLDRSSGSAFICSVGNCRCTESVKE